MKMKKDSIDKKRLSGIVSALSVGELDLRIFPELTQEFKEYITGMENLCSIASSYTKEKGSEFHCDTPCSITMTRELKVIFLTAINRGFIDLDRVTRIVREEIDDFNKNAFIEGLKSLDSTN
ncbi:MAG: hypothetical protein VB063_06775 [Bacteroides graminisolvens]|nr:hypothetical protein [Bacteroides graminisolvens]